MQYVKMNPFFDNVIVNRTIYHNPHDKSEIRSLIRADDILAISTDWLSKGHCIITEDITVEFRLSIGEMPGDFVNNEFTVAATEYFI